MGSLEFPALLSLITAEYERLSPVHGDERRVGAQAELPAAMEDFAQAVQNTRSFVADNPSRYSLGVNQLARGVMEVMSVLFAAGAATPVWRHWAGLTSVAYHAGGWRLACAEYAAIAGEWELLARIDRSPVKTGDGGGRIFWELIGGQGPTDLRYRDDAFDTAWRLLQDCFPRHDHGQIESALQVIADYWMDASEGRWKEYQVAEQPAFEYVINAVAAVARHQGFTPTKLSPDARRFLEAGLAPEEPTPLVPRIVSI